MSLSGALTTAVTGLDAQSRALGAISDNIANSQTVGYKRIETTFSTLISISNAEEHQPGGVLTRPAHTNDLQGAMQQTSLSTNLGISGQGFFLTSRAVGANSNGTPTFDNTQLFTRAGNFDLDANGFLKNSAGLFLDGWPIDPVTGLVQKSALSQIHVTQFTDNPRQTSQVAYSANLPASPDPKLDTNTATAAIDFAPSQVQVVDAQGASHNLSLNWTKVAGNTDTWQLTVTTTEPGVSVAPAAATTLVFNLADNAATGAKAGSLLSLGGVAGGVGSGASLPVTITFPAGNTQPVNIAFGKFGVAEQLTNFTGTDVVFRSAQQDGLPPGSFRNLEIDNQGVVTLSYDNGSRKPFFKIPVATFTNANGLKPESGNAYSITSDSGTPAVTDAGSNGAGTLIPSAVENSNVDIAAEFTKMIQTQRAYSANTRIVTVTSQLLDETNQMVR